MSAAHRADLRRGDVAVLLLSCVPLFVYLGGGLWGSEARWLFVSEGMLRSGDWFDPRILGDFYGDKPLLSYWLIALLASPFGRVDETLARLPSALSAAGVVLMTARCGLLLGMRRRPSVMAGLVVATSVSLLLWARSVSADLVSLLFATAAVTIYLEEARGRRYWHAPVFFLLLALSGQTKGMPEVIVPLAVVCADLLISGRLGECVARRRQLVASAILAALVYLAPFVASRIERGDWALLNLVWVENFVRAFEPFDHRANVLYYVYTLPAMLLPWGLWLPGAWISAAWHRDRSAAERFGLVAFSITFALFTCSGSRRSYYILPIFPWAALLIAAYWDRLSRAGAARGPLTCSERWLGVVPAWLFGGTLCLAGSILLLVPALSVPLRELVAALPGASLVGVAAIAAGAWLSRTLRQGDLRAATAAVMAAALVASAVQVTSVRAARERHRVEASFAAQVKDRFPGRSVVYYGGVGLDLQWYLGKGTEVTSPEQLTHLLETDGSRELLVVCGKAGTRCLDGAPGLRAEPLIDRWIPALRGIAPAKHQFTLLRVTRSVIQSQLSQRTLDRSSAVHSAGLNQFWPARMVTLTRA